MNEEDVKRIYLAGLERTLRKVHSLIIKHIKENGYSSQLAEADRIIREFYK